MVRYSAFEMYSAVITAFREANEPILYREETAEASTLVDHVTLTAGEPATLLHHSEYNLDVNELVERRGIGHPHKVFVHAGDLARLTGCSLETGRGWLERFTDRQLVELHGDGSARVEGDRQDVGLYYPLRGAAGDVMKALYLLDNEPVPDSLQEFREVTPGQFTRLDGSRFVFDQDDAVVVNVAKPDGSSKSLQQHVKEQLHEHGLTPSSPKNFVHTLRTEADLT